MQVVNAGAQGRHRSHKSHWGECSPFNPYHMTLTYDTPHVTVTPREGEKKIRARVTLFSKLSSTRHIVNVTC
jgi:hypothetical protein